MPRATPLAITIECRRGCHSGVDEHGVTAELHRERGVRGGADPGVEHDRNPGTLGDHYAIKLGWRAEGHDGGTAPDIFEPAQVVYQHNKPTNQTEEVQQSCIELDPVERMVHLDFESASGRPRREDHVGRSETAGRVRQEEQRTFCRSMTSREREAPAVVDPPQGDGDEHGGGPR